MKTIPLTQNKVALVDDADFAAVSAFKWYAQKDGRRIYARRNLRLDDGSRSYQFLHQFLMPEAEQIDHRDGDGLNNLRDNLRIATKQQNRRAFLRKAPGTTSNYRGVSWKSENAKWVAQIKTKDRKIHLGYFSDPKDAARAFNTAAQKYFGDRAHLNSL